MTELLFTLGGWTLAIFAGVLGLQSISASKRKVAEAEAKRRAIEESLERVSRGAKAQAEAAASEKTAEEIVRENDGKW